MGELTGVLIDIAGVSAFFCCCQWRFCCASNGRVRRLAGVGLIAVFAGIWIATTQTAKA